ncbi:RagB/SusD family nutrient uptake outer membrane protein [Niabella hirudinis]|uniref:RagB/SusD family nutrient uptake outer membrane protein n=1 Tax=Niabella hirudinis TaxID=1285929 RepID=UPI003EC0FE58
MRLNRIHQIAIIIIVIGVFSGCSKKFDLKPSDGIIRNNFWQTKEQVRAAVIGCYAALMGDPDGGKSLAETLFTWGELRGDMITAALGTKAEDLEIMNVNTQATNTITDWRPVYKIINYCNTVLDYAPSVLDKDKTFTQATLNGYIAEAKTIRALMYFYLARSFGAVPLKLISTSSDEEIVQIAKSSQQDVFNQVLKDLNEAEPMAVLSYGNQATDKGRITRYTINTIQADVYLWMEKYPEAIAACDKVILSKKFGLIANSTAWFTTLFRNGNSAESIFEIEFDQQKLNVFYNMLGVSTRRFEASNKVMDQIYTTEVNFFTNALDLRSDGASVRAQDNVIWKYIGHNATDMINADGSYTHWFFYRYADVLLMKAEALAQVPGRGQEALDLLTLIRQRAGAPESTNNAPDITNADQLSLFILDERARELAFEGKRWYDVLRYSKKNNYQNIAYLQDFASSLVPANSVRTVQAKMLDHNSHYFPIYIYELQTNKQLIQNPFYQ